MQSYEKVCRHLFDEKIVTFKILIIKNKTNDESHRIKFVETLENEFQGKVTLENEFQRTVRTHLTLISYFKGCSVPATLYMIVLTCIHTQRWQCQNRIEPHLLNLYWSMINSHFQQGRIVYGVAKSLLWIYKMYYWNALTVNHVWYITFGMSSIYWRQVPLSIPSLHI